MKILMMSLIGSVGLFLGTANATPTDTADLAKDQTQVAKQGRGGHDDPPGDDHDGLVVIAKQGRGGHDDPPGDDHDGLVVIG